VRQLVWGIVAIVILLAISACTLNSANSVRENSMDATQTAIPLGVSTLDDVSGSSIPGANSGIPATPVLQSNQTATSCGKLRVNVGTDPKSTLRLREQPNNTSTVVLLIPNNTLVTKVASSQEISAGGYTWVNIQYTDPNVVIATGWAANDGMKTQLTLTAAGC
jgi:hypothetical protein